MHKNIDKTELFNFVQMCYLQVLPIVKPINNNSFQMLCVCNVQVCNVMDICFIPNTCHCEIIHQHIIS